MTDSKAKEMLKAYMECERRKNEVVYEKQCHEDCDNCNLCYAQGTVGEHKEAVNMAIKALEKQIKKENADGCVGCAFEDVEEWEMPCRKCKRGCKDYWRAKE